MGPPGQKKDASQLEPEKAPGPKTADHGEPLTSRKWLGRGLAICIVLLLLWWLTSQFRYEVIPVGIPQRGESQYIVKDRWTDEIEVVWQRADGKLFRSTRRLFEDAPSQ